MPVFKNLKLSELRALRYAREANVGDILQFIDNEGRYQLGLRCQHFPAGGGNPGHTGFVAIEGDKAGIFVNDGELVEHALVLNNVATIVLLEQLATGETGRQAQPGDVYRATDRDRNTISTLIVQFGRNIGRDIMHLHLTGERRGHITHVTDQFYIGKAAVVESASTTT